MPKNGDITNAARQGYSLDEAAGIHRRIVRTLQVLGDDELRQFVRNLYDHSSSRERALQDIAAGFRERFRVAVLVDNVCWSFGWRLSGFGWFDPWAGTESNEDVLQTPDLVWLLPGDEDKAVRLELGDEPVLHISMDGGIDDWCRVEVAELGDALGDWLEARRAA